MCLLGRVEEIDSLLPRVRLLDLIKAERYGGCERLIALNTKGCTKTGCDVELGASGVFSKRGCNMTHFVKSEDNTAKSILNSL